MELLRRRIEGAEELESVVRTMKALAASSISQYERSVAGLSDYYTAVELGLATSLKSHGSPVDLTPLPKHRSRRGGAVIFGSDQGLVGQFNVTLATYANAQLRDKDFRIWAVGERMANQLADVGLHVEGVYQVPNSVNAITPLIGEILVTSLSEPMMIFHNRPVSGAHYEQVDQRLLPLDQQWKSNLLKRKWPTAKPPETLGSQTDLLRALIGEYLFVSLFKACAESLASEQASRLAAMERAEKNIQDMLDDLKQASYRLRQNTIDEELFDIISGFEAFAHESPEKEFNLERTTTLNAEP